VAATPRRPAAGAGPTAPKGGRRPAAPAGPGPAASAGPGPAEPAGPGPAGSPGSAAPAGSGPAGSTGPVGPALPAPAPAPGIEPVAAPGATGAPGPVGGAGDPVVLRVVAGVLVTVATVGLAVIEAFLVPLRIGSVPVPICVPLAVVGTVFLTRLAARQTGSVVAAALQPVLWLVTVVVLSLPRPEGDVIVEGTLTGLVFLFVGAIAGAYAVASEVTRRTAATTPRGR
jgi:hypothetical protein